MQKDPVLSDIDADGVATLTLNRPQRHNAFDEAMVAELIRRLQWLDQSPLVRTVVLSATGASFCAGADLDWMKRMAGASVDDNREDANRLGELLTTLDRLSKPSIALVQGNAYGGGIGLIACCDVVLAVQEARFCFSEVRLGLIPAVISPYVIRCIGERAARRYFLTAEPFTAVEARRIGLLHEVVKKDDLTRRSEALIGALRRGSPAAQSATKRLIAAVADAPLDDALLRNTAERLARCRRSEEAQEGMQAFFQRRPPAWMNGADDV